jgi:hypothetical protein
VQAYDYRAPKWFKLPKTNSLYCEDVCCILNGNIYVSNFEVVETYDVVAGKWRTISTNQKSNRMDQRIPFRRMVSYENLLWIFGYSPHCYSCNVVDPYESSPGNWNTFPILEETVLDDIGDYIIDDSSSTFSTETRPDPVVLDVAVFKTSRCEVYESC